MNTFDREEERAALYSGFLNTKGRLKYDAFIFKPKDPESVARQQFWIDHH
jgi:hypothetical protein